MTQQEARERAWRTWLDESMPGESGFVFAWDARGRYDEQRIAALVAVAKKVQRHWTHGDVGTRFDIELELAAALRALAGQTEDVSAE